MRGCVVHENYFQRETCHPDPLFAGGNLESRNREFEIKLMIDFGGLTLSTESLSLVWNLSLQKGEGLKELLLVRVYLRFGRKD